MFKYLGNFITEEGIATPKCERALDRQHMLGTDEDKTGDNSNEIRHNNIQNPMDRVSQQHSDHKEMSNKRTLILKVSKRKLKFHGHIMKMEGFEKLNNTEHIDSERQGKISNDTP